MIARRSLWCAVALAACGGASASPELAIEQVPGQVGPPPPQLSHEPPSARGSAPLSTPAQGRTGRVAPVGGVDRCDPAGPAADQAQCARILEHRAAEFEKPGPPEPSPEARLMVFGSENLSRSDPDASARRAAAGEVDDAIAAQALAAAADDKSQSDRGLQAIVDAVGLAAGQGR